MLFGAVSFLHSPRKKKQMMQDFAGLCEILRDYAVRSPHMCHTCNQKCAGRVGFGSSSLDPKLVLWTQGHNDSLLMGVEGSGLENDCLLVGPSWAFSQSLTHTWGVVLVGMVWLVRGGRSAPNRVGNGKSGLTAHPQHTTCSWSKNKQLYGGSTYTPVNSVCSQRSLPVSEMFCFFCKKPVSKSTNSAEIHV